MRQVVLDVVVTDKANRPVKGLQQQDFSVSENGELRALRSFREHSAPSSSDVTSPLIAKSTKSRGPLCLILLDLLYTPTEEQASIRQQLLNFVQQKPATSRFAIFVLRDGLHLVQGITKDKNLLLAAINSGELNPAVVQDNGSFTPGRADRALAQIAHFVSDEPGRKSLIWISSDFSMAVPTSETLIQSKFRGWHTGDNIRLATDLLALNRIAVYPVRTSASKTCMSVEWSEYTRESTFTDATGNERTSPAETKYYSGVECRKRLTSKGDLKFLASQSGGRAFESTKALSDAISRAERDGSNYYTLRFAPSKSTFDGKIRQLRVSLAKSGYTLSYRRSYYADDPEGFKSLSG